MTMTITPRTVAIGSFFVCIVTTTNIRSRVPLPIAPNSPQKNKPKIKLHQPTKPLRVYKNYSIKRKIP